MRGMHFRGARSVIVYCLAATMSLVLSMPVLAEVAVFREQPKSYVASNIMVATLDAEGIDQQPGGFLFRLGGMMDEYYGAEVRLGRGFWHESDQLPGGGRLRIDIDHVLGVYFTGRKSFPLPFIRLPLVDGLFVQGQLGVADVQLKGRTLVCGAECSRSVDRRTTTDLSWGVGVGTELTLPKMQIPGVPRNVGLSLEYMNYGGKNDLDITSLEAGIMVFF